MSKDTGEKIYVGNGRNIKTNYGDMLVLSFHADDVKKMKEWQDNNNGWVSLKILERKEPSKKGSTHYGIIDTWKPSKNHTYTSNSSTGDDLPF